MEQVGKLQTIVSDYKNKSNTDLKYKPLNLQPLYDCIKQFKNIEVLSINNIKIESSDIDPIFDLLKKNHEVIILNTAPLFCDEKNCSMEKNGKVLYRDDTHLNIEGSRYIGKFIADEMKKNKLF